VVVTPAKPWWDLEFGEIWRYRDLLRELTMRDLTAIYKQTILGPLWVVVQPLITSIMFAIIFGLVARMSQPGIPGLLFYMAAIVPWTYFAAVITKTAITLQFNASMTTKVYFPRVIPALATTASNGFTFLVQLVLFFVFAIIYRISGSYAWSPGPELLWLPVLILQVIALSVGCGLIVAALTTRYRDLSFLIAFGVQLLMYMSPVIIPLSKVAPDSKVRFWLEANPVTPIIEGFRGALLGTDMNWGTLWYASAVSVIVLLASLALFQRAQRNFADVI